MLSKKREQILQLRAKVLQAEYERINGEETISVSETRKRLMQTALCNHKVMTTTIKRVDNFVKSVYAIDKGVD